MKGRRPGKGFILAACRTHAHTSLIWLTNVQLRTGLEIARLADHARLVRLEPLLAAVVGRRDVDRLDRDRRCPAIAGRLEQLAELDVDPGLGCRTVVNQDRVAGQQVVLVQRRRVGVIAVERGEHDFQPLSEQVVFQRLDGGFIFRVADQIQLRRPARRLHGGGRLRLFLGRCQAADQIFLEQVQIALDDLRPIMKGRVFLHAAQECALSFVGGFATPRHPDQSLEIGPASDRSAVRRTCKAGIDSDESSGVTP